MIKLVGTFVVGIVLGAATVLLVRLAVTEHPVATEATPERTSTSPIIPVEDGSPAASLAQIRGNPSEFDRNAALYDLLEGADVHMLERLLDEAGNLPNTERSVSAIIYSRFVDLAPRDALNHLLADGGQLLALPYALSSWARQDLDEALSFVETLTEPQRTRMAQHVMTATSGLSGDQQDGIAKRFSIKNHLVRFRASARVGTDPAGAWRTASAMERGEDRTQTLWTVAWVWFGEDPQAALTAVESVADKSQRESWRSSLMNRWIAEDPRAAMDWTLALPISDQRTSLLARIAEAIAKDAPAEMLAFAQGLGDTKARRAVARKVLAVWSKTEPASVLAALEDIADREVVRIGEQYAFDNWVESDPRAAYGWALSQRPSESRSSLLTQALAVLAQSGRQEALALAADLEGEVRIDAIERIVQDWSTEDPRGAAAWLDGSPYMTPNLHQLVSNYAELDPLEALDWLQTQPADVQRSLVSVVTREVAESSPEAAWGLITHIDDEAAKRSAAYSVVSEWIDHDPRTAVRAIARLDPDLGQPLYATAFEAWARTDPGSAHAFLNQIPRSGRDGAIHGLMQRALRTGETASAEELFDRIVHEQVRRTAATEMYFRLRQTDPKRAERFRKLSHISTEEDGSVTIRFQVPDGL